MVDDISRESRYKAIHECHAELKYPVLECCPVLHVAPSAYYNWLKGNTGKVRARNEKITHCITRIHEAHPDMGYRRIRDTLAHDYNININDKTVLKICRQEQIKSTIKYAPHSCTRSEKSPAYLAENLLQRDFHADRPGEKWVTDVSEFAVTLPEPDSSGNLKREKLYLSAILDLFDRRIISYVIGKQNNNELVFETFRQAVIKYPDAHPLFHSDRGFQYTNKTFHNMLEEAGMTQSMSRVGCCTDNGAMEGFWGILKRERYYKHTFANIQELINMIHDYIHYYNNERVQRKLGVMTPEEKYRNYKAA